MSRRKRPQDDLPVVFIHGLGGGLWCYLKFILKLWWQSSHRPIFLIELPHVSMRLTSAAPSLDQFTHEVSAMLRRHYYDAATFVAHSLGTAYVSYLIQKTKKVAGCVMMDPICFKTYDAGLLYNFVWRRPTRANEFLVWWLVARELFISQWISRQMPPQPTPAPNPLCHIYVSSDDNIIDAPTVSTYLTSNKVEHTVLEGYDHAQFLLSESVEWGIIERIESVCEEARRECGRRVEKGRRRRRYKR
ncbi:Alpha/Beta hydrolase protein [Gaertneriomyces semiglobifer]|nr:Alpha/Beta hydrolase protein [Gaertneriomyces semiglobifer]